MKKFFAISLLAVSAFAVAQQQPTSTGAGDQATAQGGQQQGQPAQQQQLVIKDPAEYQAYMNATQQSDPNSKAQQFEAFLQQYPNTVVKKDALEQLMAAYQQAGNAQKLDDAANRLLQLDPNNERALILMAIVRKDQGLAAGQQAPTDPTAGSQQMEQAADFAQRAIQNVNNLQKGANISDADFQKQKDQVVNIMHGIVGDAAFKAKNWPVAQQNLLFSARSNQTPQNVIDIYWLALSYLQAAPKLAPNQSAAQVPEYQQNMLNGLFWMAKAVALAPAGPAKQQFTTTGQYFYKKYHGSTDGWDQVVQAAASQPEPTPNFQITPAPSPAEQITQLLNSTTDILSLGFDNWETILTYGKPEDQAKVWNFLKGKPLELPGTVISATESQIQLAVSQDAINEKRADVTVNLAKPLANPPAAGTADYSVVGKADSYTGQPTFMLTLIEGAPKTAPAKAAPTRRTPAHRRPSH